MIINGKKIVVAFLAGIFIFLSCAFAGAQTQKQRHQPRRTWKEAAAVEYAKKYPVSDIEPGLPRQSFASWFREIVGKEAKIAWTVNDCGEQTGTAADRGRDFPLCVESSATVGAGLTVVVAIQFGTFKRGVSARKPIVRNIVLGREDGAARFLEKLSELPESLHELLGK